MSGYRKKLIEVALPLAAINAESAREKSIRHGHPSTLHLWWARRPLAACRAVLFSSLVDDPDSDPQYQKADGSVNEEAAGIKRADLFNLIEELVMWENSNNSDVIRTARAEIARCVASHLIETEKLEKNTIVGENTTAWDLVTKGHCRPQPLGLDKKAGRVRFSFDMNRLPPAEVVNKFLAEHAPPVLDPFAGGGSIPLEAQRLGLRAYASDLNPVPVLINKALIELPPKFAGRPPVNPESRGKATPTKGKTNKGKSLVEKEWPASTGLAEDVRYYGQWMRDEAEKRIGHLYPKVEITEEIAKDRPDLLPYAGQQLTVIAWLWARTVRCPNPACNFTAPLVKSFSLSKKRNATSLIPTPDQTTRTVRFKVTRNAGAQLQGTVGRKGAVCVACSTPINLEYIRSEGKDGRIGTQMMAIVAEGNRERVFLPASDLHASCATGAIPDWKPDLLMAHNPFSLRPPLYGLKAFADLFTARQLTLLGLLGSLVEVVRSQVEDDSRQQEENGKHYSTSETSAYGAAIATYMAFLIDQLANHQSSVCGWNSANAQMRTVFARQAIAMAWDFAESNPFCESSGSFHNLHERMVKGFEAIPSSGFGQADQLSAAQSVERHSGVVISTDPPYYNNIDYADLSDFFYVWLRRSCGALYPSLFATVATPKSDELVASPYRFDGSKELAEEFFEAGLSKVFHLSRAAQIESVPLTVFYAFKQSEGDDEADEDDDDHDEMAVASTGWDTMLQGMIESGLAITGTWPMRTEKVGRSMGIGMNALASSVVLVCRPRPRNASLATRKEFITALRRELPDALRNLQRGNIAPVDLAQAAIGPGMAVFTRYSKVLESDGSPMTVRTALVLINQTLDEVLAEQEGEFDGDTRWALSWFEQFGMDDGPFGDAETLSKAKNTAINGLQEAGVIIAKAGKVRLVKRDELPADWNPATDKRLTVWEVTQHLIHRLDQKGEMGAAELVQQLGSVAEVARDLAYRLYSTCERKKWAQDALAYNSLVVAWPELTKLALARRNQQPQRQQQEMF